MEGSLNRTSVQYLCWRGHHRVCLEFRLRQQHFETKFQRQIAHERTVVMLQHHRQQQPQQQHERVCGGEALALSTHRDIPFPVEKLS